LFHCSYYSIIRILCYNLTNETADDTDNNGYTRILIHSQPGILKQEALEYEFELRNIPARKEVPLQVFFKDRLLSKFYITDFICHDKIIVELKSVTALHNEHKAQVLNYLKATKFTLGLLINFGTPKLDYKRIICEYPESSA